VNEGNLLLVALLASTRGTLRKKFDDNYYVITILLYNFFFLSLSRENRKKKLTPEAINHSKRARAFCALVQRARQNYFFIRDTAILLAALR
jgi:hypothetical protein